MLPRRLIVPSGRHLLSAGVTVLALVGVAGCGAVDGRDRATSATGDDRTATGTPGTSQTSGSTPAALHTGTGTVLESPEHGPELCLAGVADSLPPQCGGVPLRGWDWTRVDGERSAHGTTWGSYRVTGRYDGSTLTLTSPPTAPSSSDDRVRDGDSISTPCPTPEGGWRVVGAGPVGEEGLQAVQEVARTAADFAGLWIDQPAPGNDPETAPAPPEQVVLNAAFTGDLDRHEAELRRVWAGPLCVSELPRTFAELTALQDELLAGAAQELGLEQLFSGADETRGVVELGVVAATPEQEAAVQERYGDAVELTAGLQPVD